MAYLLLVITIFTATVQSVFTKQYGKKETNGPIVYSALSTFFALVVFVVSSGFRFEFNSDILGYAFGFAAAYASAVLASVIALSCGPLSITSLIVNYSLIVPAFYGILLLNEPVKWTLCVGFVLLIISLAMVNLVKSRNGTTKINLKWLIAVVVAFVGNGMCSTVQKAEQVAFDGAYKNEFMILSLLIVGIALLAAVFLRERGTAAISVRKGWHLALLYGISNGITNLLVMIVGGMLPVSLLFPVISAGGVIIASLISIFVYHEKLSRLQLAGVGIGVVAIVFLNL